MRDRDLLHPLHPHGVVDVVEDVDVLGLRGQDCLEYISFVDGSASPIENDRLQSNAASAAAPPKSSTRETTGEGLVAAFRVAAALAVALASAASGTPASYGARPAAPFLFTPMDERGAAFSPDGKTVVYSLRLGEYRQVLVMVERHGRRWGEPEVPSFSGVAYDGTPSFSPDGRQLFFASNRSAAGGTKGDFDIWMVTRNGRDWGSARPVPGEVNSSANETAPMLTRSGYFYFASSRSGAGDIYVADARPNGFDNPRSAGAGVNSDYPESYPAVTPDEKIMVFMSAGRPDQALAPGHPYTRSDLYISHWTGDHWGQAGRLGPAINTKAAESSPYFSADGRWFYFMSEHGFATDQQVWLTPAILRRGMASPLNALGNVYAIRASQIEKRR
jgi:hypothetical protein